MTERKNTNSIDDYSIFDLIEASLSQQQQDSYLLELNDEVWSRFIEQRMPFLLTEPQLDELRDQLNSDVPFDEILTWLQDLVPNTPALVAEYTRELKIEEVEHNLVTRLVECKQILANDIPNELRHQQEERLERLTAAVGFAETESWADVYRVLHDNTQRVIGSDGYSVPMLDDTVDPESN